MVLDERFLQFNIKIGNVFLAQRQGPFMHPRLAQKRTIERTVDGNFAARSTALRTNFGAHTRAMPAGAPLLTKLA
jgi:hypothetical protein